MKACTSCHQRKPASAFYRHPYGKDGLMSKCKECAKEASRRNRAQKAEYYREYDRWRYRHDPKVKERNKRYASSERGAEKIRAAKKRYSERNVVKCAAHVMTGNAIRDGKITKQPCEVCGALKVHAHHDDYAKPLSVRFLCPKHHKEWHDENGEGANAQ